MNNNTQNSQAPLRALVTGASRGIGAAVAEALARDGYSVGVNYNASRADAEALAQKIGGVALQCDVSDREAVQNMLTEFGDVDALICNAGVALQGLFQDTAPQWQKLFNVNLGGAINCIDASLRSMIARKRGKIIIISSIWGERGASCEALYSASKAALIGLAKSLAKELGPSGITVNCVAPGVIDTQMNANLTPQDLEALREATPLGRLGTAQDIAETVAWLCSPRADFITGQTITADGGI